MQLSYVRFRALLGTVYSRTDDVGFVRVWGWFIDPSERVITFWRHAANSGWQFKHHETYHHASSLASREDEKIAKGYELVPLGASRIDRTLRDVHQAFLRAEDQGAYHEALAVRGE